MSKKLHTYAGKQIEVTYDADVCAHAAKCVGGLPAVFDPNRRPWVAPDEAPSPEELIRVIGLCPTGALGYTRIEEATAPTDEAEPAAATTITLAEDGPLLLKGEFVVVAPDGTVVREGTKCALCRCGASANKPFCDGSHKEIGFSSR